MRKIWIMLLSVCLMAWQGAALADTSDAYAEAAVEVYRGNYARAVEILKDAGVEGAEDVYWEESLYFEALDAIYHGDNQLALQLLYQLPEYHRDKKQLIQEILDEQELCRGLALFQAGDYQGAKDFFDDLWDGVIGSNGWLMRKRAAAYLYASQGDYRSAFAELHVYDESSEMMQMLRNYEVNSIYSCNAGQVLVRGNYGKYQLMDVSGQVLETYDAFEDTPTLYEATVAGEYLPDGRMREAFRGDVARVSSGFKYGIINRAGEEIIPIEYEFKQLNYDESFIYLIDQGFLFIMDHQGRQVAGPTFSEYDVEAEYRRAKRLVTAGKLDEAYEAYYFLGDYADARQRMKDIEMQMRYEQALEVLDRGDFDSAKSLFRKLVSYSNAQDMTLYAAARRSMENGGYDMAERCLLALSAPVRDSEELLQDMLPYVYSQISIMWDAPYQAVKKLGHWGLIDGQGQLVLPCEWSEISYEQGVFRVRRDNFCGLMDDTLQWLVPCEYEDAVCINGNLLFVLKDSQWCAYDQASGRIETCPWEGVSRFNDRTYFVCQDALWGMMSAEGELLAPCLWDVTSVISEELAIVKQGEAWAVVNSKGEITVPFEEEINTNFFRYRTFSEGYIPIRKAASFGFMDVTGTVAIPFIWDAVGDFSEGLACVRKGEEYSYIDTSGNVVLTGPWTYAGSFQDGRALVCEGESSPVCVIDHTGEVVVTTPFTKWYVGDASEGLVTVHDKGSGLFGFIDMTGELVIPYKWAVAGDFVDGYARVHSVDGAYGHIGHDGEPAYPLSDSYDSYNYVNGRFYLMENDHLIIYDTEGNRVN